MALVLLLVTAGVLVVLWQWVDGLGLADADKKAAAHLDVVKVVSGIAVGGGGLFALYLAARRQRTQELELAQRDRAQAHTESVAEHTRLHAERTAAAAEQDAAERRITELYAKSVEHLGSASAPVRLGGLYALDRLADGNPEHRQTVVDVVCAYLRMPYPPVDEADQQEWIQEREVRVTAQRILASRCAPTGRHPTAGPTP
ncbi:hypothetical protein AB0K14_09075 [Actinosynnema sp. NPDC050801]|uniref:hypothetical protein n=1 Tax=unclassified Actinosynnema TaxID=2637065 RepID=UPI0034079FC4